MAYEKNELTFAIIWIVVYLSLIHISSIKPDEKGKPQSGFLFAAGTPGIAALAAQGGVALSLIHI